MLDTHKVPGTAEAQTVLDLLIFLIVLEEVVTLGADIQSIGTDTMQHQSIKVDLQAQRLA